ncbi:MAG: ATP phosphoribosyltransferase [Gammaproteobacteria bacterium]|nr:ATP phosphoribosyltransferase [Gammaproteobacteria bacterium]
MKTSEQRIKIALQKSGRLSEKSLDLLTRCGLKFTQSKDQLFCFGENMPIDLLFVRDDDIPGLVSDDVCDLGIVGLNVIRENQLGAQKAGRQSAFDRVRSLNFGQCRLAIAAPDDVDYPGPQSLQNARIATSYVAILEDYLQQRGIDANVVYISGAVEIAPRLGKADFICDLVSTGSTLSANQLREVETVLESEAVIIQTRAELPELKRQWIDRLIQRLDGVLQVQESKYVMLHAPRTALDAIVALLPGSESPTVIPLDLNGDKVAVHAVCRENVFWETLEDLKGAGASSLLVVPVEKMLA